MADQRRRHVQSCFPLKTNLGRNLLSPGRQGGSLPPDINGSPNRNSAKSSLTNTTKRPKQKSQLSKVGMKTGDSRHRKGISKSPAPTHDKSKTDNRATTETGTFSAKDHVSQEERRKLYDHMTSEERRKLFKMQFDMGNKDHRPPSGRRHQSLISRRMSPLPAMDYSHRSRSCYISMQDARRQEDSPSCSRNGTLVPIWTRTAAGTAMPGTTDATVKLKPKPGKQTSPYTDTLLTVKGLMTDTGNKGAVANEAKLIRHTKKSAQTTRLQTQTNTASDSRHIADEMIVNCKLQRKFKKPGRNIAHTAMKFSMYNLPVAKAFPRGLHARSSYANTVQEKKLNPANFKVYSPNQTLKAILSAITSSAAQAGDARRPRPKSCIPRSRRVHSRSSATPAKSRSNSPGKSRSRSSSTTSRSMSSTQRRRSNISRPEASSSPVSSQSDLVLYSYRKKKQKIRSAITRLANVSQGNECKREVAVRRHATSKSGRTLQSARGSSSDTRSTPSPRSRSKDASVTSKTLTPRRPSSGRQANADQATAVSIKIDDILQKMSEANKAYAIPSITRLIVEAGPGVDRPKSSRHVTRTIKADSVVPLAQKGSGIPLAHTRTADHVEAGPTRPKSSLKGANYVRSNKSITWQLPAKSYDEPDTKRLSSATPTASATGPETPVVGTTDSDSYSAEPTKPDPPSSGKAQQLVFGNPPPDKPSSTSASGTEDGLATVYLDTVASTRSDKMFISSNISLNEIVSEIQREEKVGHKKSRKSTKSTAATKSKQSAASKCRVPKSSTSSVSTRTASSDLHTKGPSASRSESSPSCGRQRSRPTTARRMASISGAKIQPPREWVLPKSMYNEGRDISHYREPLTPSPSLVDAAKISQPHVKPSSVN